MLLECIFLLSSLTLSHTYTHTQHPAGAAKRPTVATGNLQVHLSLHGIRRMSIVLLVLTLFLTWLRSIQSNGNFFFFCHLWENFYSRGHLFARDGMHISRSSVSILAGLIDGAAGGLLDYNT